MSTANNKTEILPTVVPNALQDILAVSGQYKGTEATLHLDISDGTFAMGGKWNKPEELSKDFLSSQKFEVHLMVANPEEEAARWLPLAPVRIIFHHEACKHAVSLAEKIIEGNSIPAVALKLETPTTVLEDVYPDATNFHLMSVNKLGKQGEELDAHVYKKISSCKELFPDAIISVDGGVTEANAKDLVLCGASKLCVGAALAKSKDPGAAYKNLLSVL